MHSKKSSIKAPHRPKKRKSTSSSRSKRFSKVESVESVVIEEEEEESYPAYNYREELTYLFFTSAVAHIIESRETVFEYTPVVEAPLKLPPIAKDIREPELSPIKGSKLRKHKSTTKAKGLKGPTRDNNMSKKSILSVGSISETDKYVSKQSIMSTADGSILSIHDDLVTSTPKKKKKNLDWILQPQDKVEKIIFKNGNIYEGETSRWLMHGRGIFLWSDRTFYKGEFKDGFPDGKGTMKLSDLSIYEGNFKRSFFHGVGNLCIASTPNIYKGSWKNGKKHGFGWYLYDQDSLYEGEWFEDKRHGRGFRRYKCGAKYKGMWRDNKKNGEGSMVWKNNDLYVGEWKDDKFNGYGEYTWNAVFTNLFLYPYCSWYKGNWVDGIRNGAGVMNFGTISGATLAGIWRNNQKHGPGIMICGNGLILQCNPLFVNDKPVHLNLVKTSLESENGDERSEKEDTEATVRTHTEEVMDETNAYRKVIRKIYTKIPLDNFDHEILQMITQNGLKIGEDRFIKLENSDSNEMKMFRPLNIPIHTVAEEVDLKYIVDTIWYYYFPKGEDSSRRNKNMANDKYVQESKDTFSCSKDDEENLLRNLITGYLPRLLEIYNQYAIIMTGETYLRCRVLLIRLFLWQLLRDADLPRKGVSLTDADEFIAKNPSCCLESDHCPFEVIYFWQFVQALVGCSWLIHVAKRRRSSAMMFVSGTMSHIFRQFLEDHIFRSTGKFVGSCLTTHKDLVAIKGVYELYLRIGEPHSVSDFLYFTVTEETEPLCFPAIDYGENKIMNISDGYNIIVGDKILYLQAEEDVATRIPRNPKKETYTDRFYKTLYTFRILGKNTIIHCLQKICPHILARGKLNLEYKLTFIEFFEILLLCAYEKAEWDKKAAYEALKQDPDIDTLKSNSTMSKLGHKKKKHK